MTSPPSSPPWGSTGASRSATRWAVRSLNSSGSAIRRWSTVSCSPRRRRGSTAHRASSCCPDWRRVGAFSPVHSGDGRSPSPRWPRAAGGGPSGDRRGGGSTRSPGTIGPGSSKPDERPSGSTRDRGCATHHCRRPLSRTRDDDIVPHRRQLALARGIPGATLRVVDGGHSACTTAPELFVPSLVEACVEVAGRAGFRVTHRRAA